MADLVQSGASPGFRDPHLLPRPDLTMGSPTLGFLPATPSPGFRVSGARKR